MSVEIRLSEHVPEFEANSVESSGGVATAERSGERGNDEGIILSLADLFSKSSSVNTGTF